MLAALRRRRLLVVVLACLAALPAVAFGVSSLTDNPPPPAPVLERPNIVFVLTDDQSLESVARMPYVSSRTDWITFDNAFLNVALCCPSRASILTGQYSHHTGVEDNQGAASLRETETVATWLQGAGYQTALLGKYLNGYTGVRIPPGWDEWQAFTKVGYFDYALNENGRIVAHGSAEADYSTDVLARRAQRFIARQTGPFFLYLAPTSPHAPRTAAPRHRDQFIDTPIIEPPSFNEADVSDKPAWVQALAPTDQAAMENQRRKQYRSLLAVDDMVRDLFTSLQDNGELDTTVVVFMTDNGYSFGEHRYARKTCAYEECIRTPLLVRYPGAAAKHVSALAQNVDIAPTFAHLAGVTPPIAEDGRNLVPLLRGVTTTWRDSVLLHWNGRRPDSPDPEDVTDVPAFWGVRTKRYKYVELETGERELYDLRVDPYELDNRAGDAALADIRADLAARLEVLRQ